MTTAQDLYNYVNSYRVNPMEPPMNAEEQTRAQCLNDAIRACTVSGTVSADEIVAAAKLFFNFVTGKQPAKKPQKKKARR